MSVRSALPPTPPPLNCNSVSSAGAVVLKWIMHEVGASGPQAVWTMYLFKMNRAGQCTFRRPEYFICSRVCVQEGHHYFCSFFQERRHQERVKKKKRTVWLNTWCCISQSVVHVCTTVHECWLFPHILYILIVLPLLCAWRTQAKASRCLNRNQFWPWRAWRTAD